MTKPTFLFLLLFTFLGHYNDAPINISVISSKNDTLDDLKYWNSNNKLNWSDFKGEVEKDSVDIIALSSIGYISTEIYDVDSNINGFELHTVFYRGYSWVKEEGRTSATLNHEQRHFDLAFIFAQEANEALKAYIQTNDNWLYSAIDSIIERFLKDSEATQHFYDLETNYGNDSIVQNEWDNFIDESLIEGFYRSKE